MSSAQERREERTEELIPRKQVGASNELIKLSNDFGMIGDIYYDVAEMNALTRLILEKIDEVRWDEAPLNENTRNALLDWLDELENYRKKAYYKLKAWLPTFIDRDYLEKRRPAPNLELLDHALDALDRLEGLQEKIQELKRVVEERKQFTGADGRLAEDIGEDVYITLLHLPRLTYWYFIGILQRFSPELF